MFEFLQFAGMVLSTVWGVLFISGWIYDNTNFVPYRLFSVVEYLVPATIVCCLAHTIAIAGYWSVQLTGISISINLPGG